MKFKLQTVVFPIIGINILMYILQLNLGVWFTENLKLVSEDVFYKPWMLLTSMFLHSLDNSTHILFNMLGLLIFGPILESRIGAKRFLIIYLTSGLIAGFAAAVFYPDSLGASGAIMGMIGALIWLMPNLRILLFFIIPMPLWMAGIAWALLDIFGFFFTSGIANAAHIAGMATGLAFGYNLKQKGGRARKKIDIGSKKHLTAQELEDYMRDGRL